MISLDIDIMSNLSVYLFQYTTNKILNGADGLLYGVLVGWGGVGSGAQRSELWKKVPANSVNFGNDPQKFTNCRSN